VVVLAVFTALVGDLDRTAPLWAVMGPWTVALVVDFVVSFSYTVAPRKAAPVGPAAVDGRRSPG
jgi:hypothetical protein